MSKHGSSAIQRLACALLPLVVLGFWPARSDAKDAGSPENFDPRMKNRYSFEYYRRHGAFGPPGERLSPTDPRGHMSHGHGGYL